MSHLMDMESRSQQTAASFQTPVNEIKNENDADAGVVHASGTFDAESQTYKVGGGENLTDTIYSIARRFDVSVRDIMNANGLDNPVIYPGQELHIPISQNANETEPDEAEKNGMAAFIPEKMFGNDTKDEDLLKIKTYLDTLDDYKNDAGKRDSKAREIYSMIKSIRKELGKQKSTEANQTEEQINDYHDELLRVFNQMLDANPAYYLADEDLLTTETLFRAALISNARLSKVRGCSYGTTDMSNPENDVSLDKDHWKKTEGERKFTPTNKGTASEAVNSIFKAGTELECDTMLTSNVYKSLLDVLGPDEFNKRFNNSDALEISDTRFDKQRGGQLLKQGIMQVVQVSRFEDLIPGDWVYFVNVPLYGTVAFWNGGAYTGENAVFEGYKTGEKVGKENARFSGFGLENQSYTSIGRSLQNDYKTQANAWAELKNNPGEEPQKHDGSKNKKLIAVLAALPLLGLEIRILDMYVSGCEVEFSGDNAALVRFGKKEVSIPDIYNPPFTNDHLALMDITAPHMRTIENGFPGISMLVKRPAMSKIKGG